MTKKFFIAASMNIMLPDKPPEIWVLDMASGRLICREKLSAVMPSVRYQPIVHIEALSADAFLLQDSQLYIFHFQVISADSEQPKLMGKVISFGWITLLDSNRFLVTDRRSAHPGAIVFTIDGTSPPFYIYMRITAPPAVTSDKSQFLFVDANSKRAHLFRVPVTALCSEPEKLMQVPVDTSQILAGRDCLVALVMQKNIIVVDYLKRQTVWTRSHLSEGGSLARNWWAFLDQLILLAQRTFAFKLVRIPFKIAWEMW